MSFDAIRWALAQPVQKSAAKFLLVALADCVNEKSEDWLCWPSGAHLSKTTSQDRKTVLAGMKYLQDAGYIVDTGEKVGQTKQIAVYLLKTPEIGTVQGDAKESQISHETVPKTGHGTSKEPVMEPVKEPVIKKRASKSQNFDAASVDLPEWLPAETWQMWVRNRKQAGKPMTADAAKLQLRNLAKYRDQGQDPVQVIEHAIASGWQGLYPIRQSQQGAAAPAKQAFDSSYYEGAGNW